jgi:DNA-binding Lrp family transcriptional regulator
VKVTSERSWAVASGLLAHGPISIKRLAGLVHVSYGWTHKVVEHLLTTGIAKRDGYNVRIVDADRLLNGAAWERPTTNMIFHEVEVGAESSYALARFIEERMNGKEVPYAFACYLPGMLYTGYSIGYSSLQAYIRPEDSGLLNDVVASMGTKGGIMLQLMRPDRDVFSSTKEVDGLQITSPGQTLLDLAGLGYSSKDLTKAMLENYGKL